MFMRVRDIHSVFCGDDRRIPALRIVTSTTGIHFRCCCFCYSGIHERTGRHYDVAIITAL